MLKKFVKFCRSTSDSAASDPILSESGKFGEPSYKKGLPDSSRLESELA